MTVPNLGEPNWWAEWREGNPTPDPKVEYAAWKAEFEEEHKLSEEHTIQVTLGAFTEGEIKGLLFTMYRRPDAVAVRA